MKKLISIALVLIMLFSLLTVLSVNGAAAPSGSFDKDDSGNIIIPYAKTAPTLDGIASANEWDNAAQINLNLSTATFLRRDSMNQNDKKASAVFSYKWNENGIYILIDVTDETTACSYDYLKNNNASDAVQITIDPDASNLSGDKAILTISGYSTVGGFCQYTGTNENPDVPFWTELWGYLNWAEMTDDQKTEAQSLAPIASKVQRTSSNIEDASTQVTSYKIEMCITPEFFKENSHSTTLSAGKVMKIGNYYIDYWNLHAGNIDPERDFTSTYQKMNHFIGDTAATNYDNMTDSSLWGAYVLGDEESSSGYTTPKTASEIQQANEAKALLTSDFFADYDAKYARIILPENRSLSAVTAFNEELERLRSIANSSRLYSATFYSPSALEALWQGVSDVLTFGTNLIDMRDTYLSLTRPLLDISSSSSLYSEVSWNAFISQYNNITSIADSCTDAVGRSAYNSFTAATDNLILVNVGGVIFGDFNGDKRVTTVDARSTLNAVIGSQAMPSDITAIDVDASNSVTLSDARLILRYAVGLIKAFPCQTVNDGSKKLYLDRDSCLLSAGENFMLDVSVYPKEASGQYVSWQSSDESVVRVSNGLIAAYAPGIATVTASTAGAASVSCRVVVKGGTPTISGFTNISGNQISRGSAFTITGTVSSPYPITSVTCGVSGTTMAKTVSLGADLNIKQLDLSAFADEIHLSNATLGNHTLTIIVSDMLDPAGKTVLTYTYYVNQAVANYATQAIGSNRQMMWSDKLIDTSVTTAALTLKHPVQDTDPVMVLGEAWEGAASDYYSMVTDVDSDGRTFYRMYYNGWNLTDLEIHICYAYSYDGINWTKPNLGIYSFQGSKNNNIILGPTSTEAFDNFFVFKDTNPNCPASQKYKAVAESYVSTALSLYSWISSDGIHWTKYRQITTDGTFDSVNTCFWDSNTQKYYCYYRYFDSTVGRSIKLVTSTNFTSWTKATPLTYNDSNPFQLYTNNIQKYYRANDVFIGFPTRYNDRPAWTKNYDNLCSYQLRRQAMTLANRYGLAITDCLFMVSDNGSKFNRFTEAWCTPGPERNGGWVYGDCYFCYGMIETPNAHKTDNDISMYAFEGKFTDGPSYLYRYTSRIDGFACYKSTYEAQKVVTKPFTFTGNHMKINFATSAGGSIYINILDKNGNSLGYTSGEVFGDKVDREVTFDGLNLSSLNGTEIRLEFVMKDAELYSFIFE